MQKPTSTQTLEPAADERLVIFNLGKENYGVPIECVSEIIRIQSITPLPGTEECLRGLINLRGKNLPVVDLRLRLSLKPIESNSEQRIVIVEHGDQQVGFIVDEVREVVTLNGADVAAPPQVSSSRLSDCVRAIGTRGSELITLLDVARLFSNEGHEPYAATVDETPAKAA